MVFEPPVSPEEQNWVSGQFFSFMHVQLCSVQNFFSDVMYD